MLHVVVRHKVQGSREVRTKLAQGEGGGGVGREGVLWWTFPLRLGLVREVVAVLLRGIVRVNGGGGLSEGLRRGRGRLAHIPALHLRTPGYVLSGENWPASAWLVPTVRS